MVKRIVSWQLPSYADSVALCASSDSDKLVVCYDIENRVTVYDTINHRVHDWSKKNQSMPNNFANRFNRMSGIVQVSQNKFILYTNYTYIVLDLSQDLPKEIDII